MASKRQWSHRCCQGAGLPSGIDINKASNNDETPLYIASINGHTDIVKVLVSLPGIDINKADKEDRTPLRVAARYEEIRAILRAKGAE